MEASSGHDISTLQEVLTMNDTQELNEFLNDLHESDGNYMDKQINLIELQNKIHAQNREMGWWSEERPFSTFVCLFHSELSEAMEGNRKGLMDDHLPQYPMFWVELADFVIRCMDYLGSVCESNPYTTELTLKSETTTTKLLADLHWSVSEAYQSDNDGFWSDRDDELIDSVTVCFAFAKLKGVDFMTIILEKVEYNKHRADHKKENREKPGGKKY